MEERPGYKQWYAQKGAASLQQPCSECNPIYKAGHGAMLEAISNENYGEAYDLYVELSWMCAEFYRNG